MDRSKSNLSLALLPAVAMLAAAALAAIAPPSPWIAAAGPLLLVSAMVVADAIQRRRAGGRWRPSASALVIAAAILVACGIVGLRDPGNVAMMVPILGSCTAIPFILAPPRHQGRCSS